MRGYLRALAHKLEIQDEDFMPCCHKVRTVQRDIEGNMIPQKELCLHTFVLLKKNPPCTGIVI